MRCLYDMSEWRMVPSGSEGEYVASDELMLYDKEGNTASVVPKASVGSGCVLMVVRIDSEALHGPLVAEACYEGADADGAVKHAMQAVCAATRLLGIGEGLREVLEGGLLCS